MSNSRSESTGGKILLPKSRPVDVVNSKERMDILSTKANMQRDMLAMVALGTLAESIHRHMADTDSHNLRIKMRAKVKDLSNDVTNADELLQLLLAYCWENEYNVAAGVIKLHKDTVEKEKADATTVVAKP